MELVYSFTYLPCQTCTAKIHCEQCQETIAAALNKLSGVQSAQVSMAGNAADRRARCRVCAGGVRTK